MTDAYAERPSRIPWPPIIFVGAILLGAGLHWTWPIGLDLPAALRYGGGALLVAALAVDAWTLLTFKRRHTTVRPDRGATVLLTEGPFALSRNPIYAAGAAALVGAGIAFVVPWLAVVAPLAAVLVDVLAIRREERHLEARFGDAYRAYRAKVRRWI